ncbi:hypothetical protein [Mesorhizobium sp. M1027]|uniref:hypothetical protein n=1 Tax=Mesorhizobium sp. M1027 TaxID=2957050 RepID=UPI003337E41D
MLLPDHAKKIEETKEVRLSEYIKCDDIGALVRAGKVDATSAKSMRLARAAHDEVNPRINVVIEFYEDATFVAPAQTGHFWRAIPSQESRSYRSRSFSRERKLIV